MILSAGARLGPYEILQPLGAGGMGEVYRARDTRLDRMVAVKVLPEAFAQDPDRLNRFEREAKAVAALSHPNIVALHDFGTDAGIAYTVMELLEGESLGARLAFGALPPRKAIEYAGQIASGLAAAHDKGIVHRDLKPENLFVTIDGRVKILDFGLAALVLAGGQDPTSSPTAMRQTDAGTVLGTVGYMSPEQARGQKADHRSDVFSLGCVLFEMLAGRRAFQRETAAETLTAILREDPPPFSGVTPPIPLPLQQLVLHCLEKSPAERFHSVRDLAFALQTVSGLSDSSIARDEVVPAKSPRRFRFAAVAALLLLSLAGGAFVAGRRASNSTGPSYQQLTFGRLAVFGARFSPDGQTVVYSAAVEGNTPELFTIRRDQPEPRPMGLRATHLLAVSSKGELALLTGIRYHFHRVFTGTLARMPLEDGAPREIVENVREADWSPDGESLAIIREVEGKDRLEYPIGKVLHEAPGYLSDLRVSPDGERVAFFEHPKKWDDRGSVNVVDRTGKRSVLADGFWGEQGIAWSKSGESIYFSASTAGFAFSPREVTLSGRQRVVFEGPGSLILLDVSPEGQWLLAREERENAIWAYAPGAKTERDLSVAGESWMPVLSSDGTEVLFTVGYAAAGSKYLVCLRKTDGSPVVRLGEGSALDLSPDGRWALSLVFTSPPELVLFPTGPGEPIRLERGDFNEYSSAQFFPDGKKILVCGNEPGHSGRCYVQEVSGGKARAVTPEGTRQGRPSPDGKFVLVHAGQELLVVSLEGDEPKQVALAPGEDVAGWSADGRIFVFRGTEIPTRMEKLDLATGRRAPFLEIGPADRAGFLQVEQVSVAEREAAYVYGLVRRTSQLYLVSGAR